MEGIMYLAWNFKSNNANFRFPHPNKNIEYAIDALWYMSWI